jgi:hypothetical protein
MHFTRRRLDRIGARLLVVAALFAVGGAAWSCSDGSSDPADVSNDDASAEARAEASSDAGVDVNVPPRDAAWVDVATLPITCASPPCATSLVTTLGSGSGDLGEGFCALSTDGTVACWGANGAGQLGRGEDGGTLDSANAARVVGLGNVKRIDHNCAVDGDGAAWCWGTGPFLRDDAGAASIEPTPVKLALPPVTDIAVGYGAACATAGAEVLCWGSNADGQLSPPTGGKDDPGGARPMPIPTGPSARALAVGRATLVLRDDGSLVTWGANPPIGRVSPMFPDPHPQATPLGGLFMVDLADDNACAVAGGTGYCWGMPVTPPAPGNGTITERGMPLPVVTPEPIVHIATTRSAPLQNGGVLRYRWCASSLSGAVYCWGLNDSGQAGDGTQEYAFDAVKVNGLPEPAAQVRTTPNATCALLTNGKVWCWGSNFNGQLGNGQSKGRSLVPVEVVLP